MSDTLIDHFRMFADYNRSANETLYATCAQLGDDERKKNRPAFFRTIHGTLNHIMVGDRIWLSRFEGGEVASTNLDAILYEDFEALVSARQVEDARIADFIANLEANWFAGDFVYVNNSGVRCNDPKPMILAHFFNHQTHHRGQIHDMLSQTDVPPPPLDLHRILRPDPTD